MIIKIKGDPNVIFILIHHLVGLFSKKLWWRFHLFQHFVFSHCLTLFIHKTVTTFTVFVSRSLSLKVKKVK